MKKFTNPIILNSKISNTSDPYVIRHDGCYYHCYGNDEGVFISKSQKLWDIGTGETVKAFGFGEESHINRWYAPELHYINRKWYIYVSPDYGNDLHVMTVLEHNGDTPMGEYKNIGMVKGLENKWSIDGTVMEYKKQLYFIWANGEAIQMAAMVEPYSITGKIITLTHPEYEFETHYGKINEGPAVLKRGDKIHVVYSASDSQCDDYCLGLLTFKVGKSILDIKNWSKSKAAVFKKTDKILGPGHCSFTTVTENGKDIDYIIYHANLESGTGWRGRSVFAQPFEWDTDNMPIFGEPQF